MSPSEPTSDRPYRLLVAACGSISAIALPQYLMAIRRLEAPIDLRVVMSDNAAHMMPLDSVAPFCDEAYTPGKFWSQTRLGHIAFAEWPDLLAVIPASCDIIARTAAGFADKPVALLTVAHPGSVMFFPNMNKYMWENPVTDRNIQQLKNAGHIIVEPLRETAFAATAGRWEYGYVMPSPRDTAAILLEELKKRAADKAVAGEAHPTDRP